MNKTEIPYLDYTWNPLSMRCTPIAEGCKNCWHIKFADRHKNNPNISKDRRDAFAGGKPVLIELESPLKKQEPSRIGVQFMGDLFHKKVPFGFIDEVMKIIALSLCINKHTFQVLTKRPERMLEYFARSIIPATENGGGIRVVYDGKKSIRPAGLLLADLALTKAYKEDCSVDIDDWPLPNLWLGTSVSTQADADKNIPTLLQIPAAVRFLSLEPLLERIDLSEAFNLWCKGEKKIDSIGNVYHKSARGYDLIKQIIIGCESGPGARLCSLDDIRYVRDQCKDAGVKCFIKQIPLPGCRKCRFEPCTHLHGHKQITIVSKNPKEWPE
nr:DUF5131 family protein [Phycisphaerae bacterium]NIU16026.1 DUF5131 family protein [candidate division Zixibacteria bacterium]NIW21377.1 DUF5131 family protein [candidate division KSB1 bacterium]NIP55642.1 DUF5131 family protein [Phycisphaerae bacterium]NIS52994.1 DUF5131 family protein [Phycisphaerae bacterium]